MSQPTADNHWRTVLRQQGRSLTWLASATGRKPRTVYAYSQGKLPAPADWLARVAVALGQEVTA
jgi:predicted transcriptional regulator